MVLLLERGNLNDVVALEPIDANSSLNLAQLMAIAGPGPLTGRREGQGGQTTYATTTDRTAVVTTPSDVETTTPKTAPVRSPDSVEPGQNERAPDPSHARRLVAEWEFPRRVTRLTTAEMTTEARLKAEILSRRL